MTTQAAAGRALYSDVEELHGKINYCIDVIDGSNEDDEEEKSDEEESSSYEESLIGRFVEPDMVDRGTAG